MGRPIYPHDLSDPDFTWLVTSFKEHYPNYVMIEIPCLPVVFIKVEPGLFPSTSTTDGLPTDAEKAALGLEDPDADTDEAGEEI